MVGWWVLPSHGACLGGLSNEMLLNAGDGTFGSAVNYSAGDDPRTVVIGDLDEALDLDLAVANGGDANVSMEGS